MEASTVLKKIGRAKAKWYPIQRGMPPYTSTFHRLKNIGMKWCGESDKF